MRPTKETQFLPLSDIGKYSNELLYFCSAIVFSPSTENDHYRDCPPYITMCCTQSHDEFYFQVPQAIAYYGEQHAGYTMKGQDRRVEEGKRQLANEIKSLLDID